MTAATSGRNVSTKRFDPFGRVAFDCQESTVVVASCPMAGSDRY